MKVKSSLSLDGEVNVSEVVGSGKNTDNASDEEHESLDTGQRRLDVRHDTGHKKSRADKDEKKCCEDHFPVFPDFWMFPPKLLRCRATVVPVARLLDEGRAVLRGGVFW